MKGIYFLTVVIIMLFFSCDENKIKQAEHKESPITDVKNLHCNAFVFIPTWGDKVYIIPSDIQDSIQFKKVDIEKAIKNKVSIFMIVGLNNLRKLSNDKNSGVLTSKPCNLPYDSMKYSRVFISYKNYSDTEQITYSKTHDMQYRDKDSCNTKSVFYTDSSSLDIHIYQ